MNNIMCRAAFAGILALSLSFQTAQAAGRRIENVQPKINLIGSPEILANIKGAQAKKPRIPGPGEPAPIWLEFETDFDSADEFPELTVKCSLLLQMGQRMKLVEGEVTLVDVAKGKDRHTVLYISPKSLNKLAENKPFTMTMVRAFWVELLVQGETFGAQFKSVGGLTYEQISKEKDRLDKSSDLMLGKAQTPFAPLFWDYYEAAKQAPR
ncbi:MAG: Amuc_1102 family pilus-like protein [Verrucomicrobiota bacterium]